MTELTDLDRECVIAYADANNSACVAANNIHVHCNTVYYHLNQVKKKTGLDPANVYDLVKILRMIGVDI